MTIAHPITSSVPEVGGLQALQARLTGELVTRGATAYDEVRKVVNINVNRRPLAIVRVAAENDVVEAVNYARNSGLPLAVHSGGHSVIGLGMVDDGIVIDLSTYKAVSIDAKKGTARVQPGATSADLAGPAHAYGLALSTGDTSSVGLGGLTTGGGIGFMVRKFGLAIDNLLSARVVTADGRVLVASETENADLFWAVRGGGGNFGIVTEFEYRMAPVGQIYGGALVLPATREVIRGYLDYAVQAPEDLTTITNLMLAPPAPFIPGEHLGQPVLMVLVCWTGSMEEGERAVAPLRALAEPVADVVGPMPYPAIYDFTAEAAQPHGVAIRSMFADQISEGTIDAALEAMRLTPSPMSMVQLRGFGGAMARVPSDATAFPHRDKLYQVTLLGLWLDPAEERAPYDRWVESLWQKVRPDGAGVYVNFLADEGESRIGEAYSPATIARLAEIKRKYDPDNTFRLNQNIPPKA